MASKQKITTFLWFDGNAEDAAKHYTSIFKNSKVLEVIRYGDAGPGPKGSVMIGRFQLEGQEFIGLNGGPQFKFTEAISLAVTCETQTEVDELWSRLSAGGEEGQCGWLKDRFGLSWQIVPAALPELIRDPDPARSNRVVQAMMQMKKIDIGQLRRASERGGASS
jgi:predicted 3-demethylubiquinone-9 3-methyltransferase (glyoxalase superfamily)